MSMRHPATRRLCVLAVLGFVGWAGIVRAGVDERVEQILTQLTLEEKVDLCHGGFDAGGVPRLGIGQIRMLDGRQGLRPMDKVTSTTSLPCALALSCTWDEAAAGAFGRVLAAEMLALDRHLLLAPMMNVVRSPLGGRNFENLGDEPFLSGRMAAAYVRGVQALGVGACACLVAANDCEARRHFTSSNMDERTLREIHLLPYEMTVREGRVWSMMSANSLLNGVHCAHNRHLLQALVKDEIGFDGVMITDWRAAYDPVPAALAGTDMTTGVCQYVFGDGRLLDAVKSGEVPRSLLDDKARRILRLYARCGVLEPGTRAKGGLDTPEHRAAARRLAAEGMVLLKNEGALLPLDAAKLRRVVVTGPVADRVLQGGGSGHVPAAVEITPLQGLRSALGGKAEVVYLPFDVPLGLKMEKGSIEWRHANIAKGRRAGDAAGGTTDIPALVEAAKSADAVLFFAAGLQASEGRDLPDMQLPGGQGEALAALAGANPNVVVLLSANGAVSPEGWGDRVPVLLAAHYSGQATGDALADVITGRAEPGGRLSYTFGRRLGDHPCHALGEWPAKLIMDKDPVNPGMKPEERRATHAFDTEYKEGVFVGHRWFDREKIEPWFPFGHGMGYSKFTIEDAGVTITRADAGDPSVAVAVKVANVGGRAGSEVVQVYIGQRACGIARPLRELKGFSKVTLGPGESRVVSVRLDFRSFAFWHPDKRAWAVEPGAFAISVGRSSREIAYGSEVVLQ